MLNPKQKRFLRTLGHDLKPVVWLGQRGLTPEFVAELDSALSIHELLKVKLGSGDKAQRTSLSDEICKQCQAEVVQNIGRMLILYRLNPEQAKIKLPA